MILPNLNFILHHNKVAVKKAKQWMASAEFYFNTYSEAIKNDDVQ